MDNDKEAGRGKVGGAHTHTHTQLRIPPHTQLRIPPHTHTLAAQNGAQATHRRAFHRVAPCRAVPQVEKAGRARTLRAEVRQRVPLRRHVRGLGVRLRARHKPCPRDLWQQRAGGNGSVSAARILPACCAPTEAGAGGGMVRRASLLTMAPAAVDRLTSVKSSLSPVV